MIESARGNESAKERAPRQSPVGSLVTTDHSFFLTIRSKMASRGSQGSLGLELGLASF